MKALAMLVFVAACDPIWGANVQLRDPYNRPIEGATLAVACRGDGGNYIGAKRSDATGAASVGSLGSEFPPDCDIYVAKPGYRSERIRYRDLCPGGPEGCERVFGFDLVLEPE